MPADPAKVGTGVGHAIVGWVKVPAAIVGTPAGQVIAPSAKAPKVLLPAGVPPLTALVVSDAPANAMLPKLTLSLAPVNACAAAVSEFTVSAGTVVLAPVKVWAAAVRELTVCAAAVSELTVSAGTVVLDPVNV